MYTHMWHVACKYRTKGQQQSFWALKLIKKINAWQHQKYDGKRDGRHFA